MIAAGGRDDARQACHGGRAQARIARAGAELAEIHAHE
jgi:hypothetical protein